MAIDHYVDSLSEVVNRYQRKIGSYDKQSWERTLEERILLRRLDSYEGPRKVAKPNSDLIDLDLIRGSAFTKAKPTQGWLASTFYGVLRVIFFPLNLSWWRDQLSSTVYWLLLALWCLQVVSVYLYMNGTQEEFEDVPYSEVLAPIFMSIILATVQSQIASSNPHSGKSYSSNNNNIRRSPQRSYRHSSYATGNQRSQSQTHVSNQRQSSTKVTSTTTGSTAARTKRSRKSRVKGDRRTPSVAESVLETPQIPGESPPRIPIVNPHGRQNRRTSDEESGFDSIDCNGCTGCHRSRKMSLSERRGMNRDSLSLNLNSLPRIEVSRNSKDGNSASDEASPVDDVIDEEGTCPNSGNTSASPYGFENGIITNKESDYQDPPLWKRRYSDAGIQSNTSTIRIIPGAISLDERRFSDDSVIRALSPTQGQLTNSVFRHNSISGRITGASESSNELRLTMKRSQLNSNDISSCLLSPPPTVNGKIKHSNASGSNREAHHHHHHHHHHHRHHHHGHHSHKQNLGSHQHHTHGHSQRLLSHRHRSNSTANCSSCESEEGTLSPTTPTKLGVTSDLEWPLIGSESGSEEEVEEDLDPIENDAPEEGDNDDKVEKEGIDDSKNALDEDVSTRNQFPKAGPKLTADQCNENQDGANSNVSSPGECFIFPEPHDPLSHRYSEDIPPPMFSFGEFDDRSRQDGHAQIDNNKVSCAIWTQNECQKVDLSVVDIASAIIRKVELSKNSNEYPYVGLVCSFVLAIIPGIFRIKSDNSCLASKSTAKSSLPLALSHLLNKQNGTLRALAWVNGSEILIDLLNIQHVDFYFVMESLFGSHWKERFVIIVAMLQRFALSLLFFFLLCVAERTFRQRFLIAKYFCHLTSSRRAKRSDLPHFRLNKVRNIKSWLSTRSYLKKHGPQRTVDVIVSVSFIIAVVILTFLCLQLLRDSDGENGGMADKLYCWEFICWIFAMGLFIMRLMILGLKVNQKYRSNLSILITEQINLYLQQEQKPHKKEELQLANHVLKLAADLLKELESPFKISGFSANPYLYNVTKVVVLSAFSAVFTELLGFKLKFGKLIKY